MSAEVEPSLGPDDVRASNADREVVVGRLNNAFSEGRIDVDELDERVGHAYAAKTLGELRPLTRDLPMPAPSPPPRVSREVVVQRGRDATNWLRYGLGSVVLVNVVIWAAVSIGSGHLIYPWWIWILVAGLCGGFGHSRGWRHDRRGDGRGYHGGRSGYGTDHAD